MAKRNNNSPKTTETSSCLKKYHLHRSRLMLEEFIFLKFYPSLTSQHFIDQLLQNAFAESVDDFQPFYFIRFAEVQDLH